MNDNPASNFRMRLGRRPHIPEAVARAPRLAARMPAPVPPPRLDRSHIPFAPSLDRNDTLPDCTAVALANSARGWAALCGGSVDVPTPNVVAFYAACVGVPVSQLASTDGAVLLDVMRRQCHGGMVDASGQVELTGPFGVIEPTDRALLAAACTLIGPVILGVDLTVAQQQPGVWDIGGDAADWGGHAVMLWDYAGLGDTDTVRVATWGTLQPVTWRWLAAQLREAYAVSWPALLGPSGRQWAALDREGLAADVAAWCG